MTQEQFDNYKFSINTEFTVYGEVWEKVGEVDFWNSTISNRAGDFYSIDYIKDIRN